VREEFIPSGRSFLVEPTLQSVPPGLFQQNPPGADSGLPPEGGGPLAFIETIDPEPAGRGITFLHHTSNKHFPAAPSRASTTW
jgi:hypothetical protein